MNDLIVLNQPGIPTLDSREVSVMVDRRHDHLLRDIQKYIEAISNLADPKVGVSDFFIESTYQTNEVTRVKETAESIRGFILDNPKARPCPFCGSDSIAIKFSSIAELQSRQAFLVECQLCGVSTRTRNSLWAAYECWQMRMEGTGNVR